MTKKILSIILSFALLLSVLPAAAAAAATDPDPTPTRSAQLAVTAASYPKLTAAVPDSAGVTLKWSAFSGAVKYSVYLRKAGEKWTRIGVSAKTSFYKKLKASDTVYFFTVRAVDKNGSFIGGYDTKGYAFRYLPAPKLVSVTAVSGGQSVSWNAVSGADQYTVWIKNGNAMKKLGVTDQTVFINRNVVSGETYAYTVSCHDKTTNADNSVFNPSGISAIYLSTPQIKSVKPGDGGMSVSWDKVPGAVRYCVFTKTDGKWKRIGYSSTASFLHTGLTDGALYTYTVRCVDKKGNFTSYCDPYGMSCRYYLPPSFVSIASSDNGVVLRWNKNNIFSSYTVYRRPFGGSWEIIGKTDDGSFTDTTADPASLYTYTLRGCDANGSALTYFKDSAVYCKNAVPIEGKQTVGGVTFSFSRGKLTTGFYTVNKRLRYYNGHGVLQKNGIFGSDQEGYAYADKNGVCISPEPARLAAAFIAKHGTGSTLSERAGSAIIYMRKLFPYRRSYIQPTSKSEIPALATDMYKRGSGNCYRYSAAYAYMIKIAGYRVRMTVGTTAGSPHGWLHLKVGSQWIMCDNRITNQKGYYFPDYTGYKSALKRWKLVANFTSELVFTEDGKAVWQ